MFENAEQELQRILALVAKCPDKLQERCFELLLSGYVDSQKSPLPLPTQPPTRPAGFASPPAPPAVETEVPSNIRPRFTSLITRTKVAPAKAAALFDFSVDPFNYHAVSVEGKSNREKMRSVAALLCLKEWLTTGNWTADWQEFKTMSIDNSCWDQANAGATLSHEWFKSAGKPGITLSSAGIAAAEQTFTKLAGGAQE